MDYKTLQVIDEGQIELYSLVKRLAKKLKHKQEFTFEIQLAKDKLVTTLYSLPFCEKVDGMQMDYSLDVQNTCEQTQTAVEKKDQEI